MQQRLNYGCGLRFFIAIDHRDQDGKLIQMELNRISCTCKFRTFEPIPEYRPRCPFVLVITSGSHSHPIPLPAKTPPTIRQEIFELLGGLGGELADLTPRRFLRHTHVRAYLRDKLPNVTIPVLSDMHISLANRAHLRAYIAQARESSFPKGTGWHGAYI